MKKAMLISLMAIVCSIASAQPQNGREAMYEEFRTKRMAYLISAVGMTTEESAKFFPLYDEMMKKKMQIFSEMRKTMHKLNNTDDATDDEYFKMVDDMINAPIREAQLEKEYYKRFKTILSPKKLFKLKREEGRYAKEILKKQGPPPHKNKNQKEK